MIEEMATLRITEAELARDIHAVPAQAQGGVEVIVEQRPSSVYKMAGSRPADSLIRLKHVLPA